MIFDEGIFDLVLAHSGVPFSCKDVLPGHPLYLHAFLVSLKSHFIDKVQLNWCLIH